MKFGDALDVGDGFLLASAEGTRSHDCITRPSDFTHSRRALTAGTPLPSLPSLQWQVPPRSSSVAALSFFMHSFAPWHSTAPHRTAQRAAVRLRPRMALMPVPNGRRMCQMQGKTDVSPFHIRTRRTRAAGWEGEGKGKGGHQPWRSTSIYGTSLTEETGGISSRLLIIKHTAHVQLDGERSSGADLLEGID